VRIWNHVYDNNNEVFEHQLVQDNLYKEGNRLANLDNQDAVSNMKNSNDSENVLGDEEVGHKDNDGDDDGVVKIRMHENRTVSILKKLATAIPWKTSEEFEVHIEWYLDYLRLFLIKKKVVSDWKVEQQNARRKSNEQVLVSEILNAAESIKDIELDQTTSRSGADGSPESPSLKDRAAAKARIAKWKAAQLEQQRREEVRYTAK
jgi:hypothetical protein